MIGGNICFRVDASSDVGTGHIMRCITLALELKKYGFYIRFVCRHSPEHLRDLIRQDFDLIVLPARLTHDADFKLRHADWLGVTQEQDANDFVSVNSDRLWRWIVVDNYSLDTVWEAAVRERLSGSKLLVIDDLADRVHDCDVLLDQNICINPDRAYTNKLPKKCIKLIGPRFALLRESFRVYRKENVICPTTVGSILVFFGGIDKLNLTSKVIEMLACSIDFEGKVNVVVGADHPDIAGIKNQCREYHFTCYVQTNKMAALMASADLFIGAGGTSIWERCYIGLPGVVIATAHNQERQVVNCAKKGVLLSQEIGEDLIDRLSAHVRTLIHNVHLRQIMAENSIRLVDSFGASRVSRLMIGSEITVRQATKKDMKSTYTWRNDTVVRASSKNNALVDERDHEVWFESVLNDRHRTLMIGELAGVTVGVVRCDFSGDRGMISIYLVPDNSRVRGLGGALLRECEDWITKNHSECKVLVAEILADNIRSENMFVNSGYLKANTVFTKELMHVEENH